MPQLPIELQRKLEHLKDDVLESEGGVAAILAHLDILSVERQGDEQRRAARECLLQFHRQSSESLCDYTARMDVQFDKLSGQGLPLPDE
eukprot:9411226-Pyramimonas_sp.AAC.1